MYKMVTTTIQYGTVNKGLKKMQNNATNAHTHMRSHEKSDTAAGIVE